LRKWKLYKTTGRFLLGFFSYTEIIEWERKTNRITATARTNDVYSRLQPFAEKDAQSEISSIKNSFIKDIWDNYLTFTIVYFAVLPNHHNTQGLNITIIIGCILILLVYVSLSWILDILHQGGRKSCFPPMIPAVFTAFTNASTGASRKFLFYRQLHYGHIKSCLIIN